MQNVLFYVLLNDTFAFLFPFHVASGRRGTYFNTFLYIVCTFIYNIASHFICWTCVFGNKQSTPQCQQCMAEGYKDKSKTFFAGFLGFVSSPIVIFDFVASSSIYDVLELATKSNITITVYWEVLSGCFLINNHKECGAVRLSLVNSQNDITPQ